METQERSRTGNLVSAETLQAIRPEAAADPRLLSQSLNDLSKLKIALQFEWVQNWRITRE